MSRLSSIEKGARRRGHLAADETVQAVAVVGSGSVSGLPSGGTASLSRAALVATDRSLYVMKLGQIGFSSVKDLILERPLEDAYVRAEPTTVEVGTAEEGALATLRIIAMQSPGDLVDYVASRTR